MAAISGRLNDISNMLATVAGGSVPPEAYKSSHVVAGNGDMVSVERGINLQRQCVAKGIPRHINFV